MLNYKIDLSEVDKIKEINKIEKDYRIKNLQHFNEEGFPNKKKEDWKFLDLREIISKNFKKFEFQTKQIKEKKINYIKDFDHNFIVNINGELITSNFKYEKNSEIKIEKFKNDNFSEKKEINSLVNLNHALSDKGYYLEIKDNYKFNKVLVVYNLFTCELNENFLNFRNKINLGKNSELHMIEFVLNDSNKNFFSNTYENFTLQDKAVLKNIYIHNNKSKGYFHKFAENELSEGSDFLYYIFPTGAKFNKLDLKFNLNGENSICNLQSAAFLDKNEHHEIKSRVNHLAPNSKSYQKIKNVVNSNSKGVYQGKIFVKDIAQKTDAYQLSKAILLSDKAEFDSKPELEIYADDVKCSHGSTSGSIDEDAIYYLMTRGLNRKEAVELLIDGFLNEIIEQIKSKSIKDFLKYKLSEQIS